MWPKSVGMRTFQTVSSMRHTCLQASPWVTEKGRRCSPLESPLLRGKERTAQPEHSGFILLQSGVKKTLPHGLSEQEQGDHHSGLPGTVLVCKYQCRHKRDSGGTVLKTFDNFNFCTLQMVIDRGTKVKFKNNKRNAGLDTVGQTNVKSYQNNNPELSVQRSNSTHPLAL